MGIKHISLHVCEYKVMGIKHQFAFMRVCRYVSMKSWELQSLHVCEYKVMGMKHTSLHACKSASMRV